ncbi:type I methionyl aminopeptidase [Angustibacter luteus]|uniref:Methionine aminopeptidase n=1 Tax=Angustibacter luteus TaxID=658456 RepID=A0ABW1JGE2_9ACTN
MIGRDRIQYKSPDQVRLMRRAGVLVGQTLQRLRESAVAGVTTGELNALAERTIREAGATPSFLGYGHPPFSGTVCISVNDEIVHGVPGQRRLADGDLVSIDCGAIVDGWHGDSAITVVVGDEAQADPADLDLLRVTEESMWRGIAALAVGERLHAVGAAVEDTVLGADAGYGIVEEYVGHGIGTEMHQDPQVPNYRVRDKGVRVRSGLVVAIEPMLTRGSAQTRVLADDWTVVSLDGSRAAHFEHTVAVGDDGLWVLTALDGGAQRLAELGAAFAPLG